MASVTVAFDTLKAATRLQEAGFEEDKARALVSTFAQGMVENLATKQDLAPLATKEEFALLATKEELAALRGEIGLLRTEIATLPTHEEFVGLRANMDGTATGLRNDMERVETGLRADMERVAVSLRAEISKVQERMTVRMGTAIAAAVGILVAVDKLL